MCWKRGWPKRPDRVAAVRRRLIPRMQKAAPLACQRSTGTAFAKATTVLVYAATADARGSYTGNQSTISMVNRYGQNMAKIRRCVKVFLALIVLFHQSATGAWIVAFLATKIGQMWLKLDSRLNRLCVPCGQTQTGRARRGPFVSNAIRSARGLCPGRGGDRFQCLRLPARSPHPGQRDLGVKAGGDCGFQPAAFFFHDHCSLVFEALALATSLARLWGRVGA